MTLPLSTMASTTLFPPFELPFELPFESPPHGPPPLGWSELATGSIGFPNASSAGCDPSPVAL